MYKNEPNIIAFEMHFDYSNKFYDSKYNPLPAKIERLNKNDCKRDFVNDLLQVAILIPNEIPSKHLCKITAPKETFYFDFSITLTNTPVKKS